MRAVAGEHDQLAIGFSMAEFQHPMYRQLSAVVDLRTGEQARQALRILVDHVRTKKLPTSKQVLVAPRLVTRDSPEG